MGCFNGLSALPRIFYAEDIIIKLSSSFIYNTDIYLSKLVNLLNCNIHVFRLNVVQIISKISSQTNLCTYI